MSVFEFSDYRKFLKQLIKTFPQGGRGVWARLSENLNVNATMVSQIMSGTKDFSIEQAQSVAIFLGLQKLEADYFILLVQIERAGTHELKSYFKEKIDELKKDSLKISKRIKSDRKLTDLERSIFYSSKNYSAIHLFCSIGKGATVESIAKKFDLPRVRVHEILQFLVSTGLCSQHSHYYRTGNQTIHVDKGSPFLIKHHGNWRIEAIKKSEILSDEELMFTANVSLSKEDFLKVRETLVRTIQEVVETVKASPSEEVANLNIDLFLM